MHGKKIGVISVAHARIENRHGLGVPRQTQVALVGDDDRVAFTGPVDDLAQVLDTEHLAGRVGR